MDIKKWIERAPFATYIHITYDPYDFRWRYDLTRPLFRLCTPPITFISDMDCDIPCCEVKQTQDWPPETHENAGVVVELHDVVQERLVVERAARDGVCVLIFTEHDPPDDAATLSFRCISPDYAWMKWRGEEPILVQRGGESHRLVPRLKWWRLDRAAQLKLWNERIWPWRRRQKEFSGDHHVSLSSTPPINSALDMNCLLDYAPFHVRVVSRDLLRSVLYELRDYFPYGWLVARDGMDCMPLAYTMSKWDEAFMERMMVVQQERAKRRDINPYVFVAFIEHAPSEEWLRRFKAACVCVIEVVTDVEVADVRLGEEGRYELGLPERPVVTSGLAPMRIFRCLCRAAWKDEPRGRMGRTWLKKMKNADPSAFDGLEQ